MRSAAAASTTLLLALWLLTALMPAAAAESPRRIAALAPHLVEMLFLLGAGDRIVVTVAHADHPPAALALPRIGDAFTLSLEALVAARPDLVLAWGGALDSGRRERLASLVPALWVSEPEDLDAVARELVTLAALVGSGAEVAASFARRVDELDGAGRRGPPLRVLPLVSLDPPMTMGRGSFIDDVVQRCGGRNPLAEGGGVVIQLSREALLATPLDLVLPLLDEPVPGARLRALFSAEVEMLEMDADLLARPGPRLLEGAEQLCALLAAQR